MRKLLSIVALGVAFAAQQAMAATVDFQVVNGAGTVSTGRPTTAAEGANDANAQNKIVHEFRVTTSSDILRIGDVFIDPRTGLGLYNNATGTDTEPPLDAFVAVFPALGADSWISTPGTTALAGAGGTTADNNSWFDTTNDGAQTGFLFARITTNPLPYVGIFRGVVSVLDDAGNPEVHPFSFTLNAPEPASFGLAGMGLIALAGLRRRFA
jgi:hypothetical protein